MGEENVSRPNVRRSQAIHTKYYDLLGVAPDVEEKELKKAYRKKALELHPDKQGGDGEPFKEMKYAYDALLDPKKRQAYDKYGEAGVKAAEGKIDSEVAKEIILNIPFGERLCFVVMLSLLSLFVLAFPILLSVKWDTPNSLTFWQVFIPVWISLAATCCCCCCCVMGPTADEDDDEDTRNTVNEQRAQAAKVRCTGYFVVIVLTLLFTFLTMRLDNNVSWSYFAVLWPWMVLEGFLLLAGLYNAEHTFVLVGGNQEILARGRWFNCEWIKFVLVDMGLKTRIAHLICAYLLASKLDGMKISWWTVFAPKWADYAIDVLVNFSLCGRVKTDEELEQMPEDARQREPTRCGIICAFIFQSIGFLPAILVCKKLEEPNSFPAAIAFFPVFLTVGCFCCCTSCCVLCCFRPGMVPDEETGLGSGQGTQRSYGSTEPKEEATAMPPPGSSQAETV